MNRLRWLRGVGLRARRCDRLRFIVLAVTFGLGLHGFAPRLQAAELMAGAARIDITPTQPVQLAGYASRKDLCSEVHDPLFARALAFEKDGDRLVMVSVDSLGFYQETADPLRQAILEASGLQPSELLLCAIHTHSAPTLALDQARGHPNNVAYTRGLQTQLAALVRNALGRLAPAELSVGAGSSPVGVNRREVVQDETGKRRIVLGRNPDAPTDREVQVLRLARPQADQPSAVLFAYATHSTSLGPRNKVISGDIHGLAEQFLERYLGNDILAPGFAGASGDIDPWVRILPEFRTERGWIPEPVLMGTMLGQEVARVLEGLESPAPEGPVRSALRNLLLPGKSRAGAAISTVPFRLTVGRVGEVAFVGFGGEVFNEIGRAVKIGSPFEKTFIFTHCNAADGYVPTRSSYAEGGYEVQSSPYAPGADERLIEATLQMLRDLK